jgi:Domain of unknown function (DUF5078)
MGRHRLTSVLRSGTVALTLGIALAFPGKAVADATDDYPIPHRMIITACTAEQILAAARDYEPIYYERYMIDKHNKPPAVQQGAIDGAHYFLLVESGGPAGVLRTDGHEFRGSIDGGVA